LNLPGLALTAIFRGKRLVFTTICLLCFFDHLFFFGTKAVMETAGTMLATMMVVTLNATVVVAAAWRV
jgi:hypothetical protein